jgi:hypothetical protein
MSNDLLHYKSRGVRALVLLHEQMMRECLEVWEQAKASGVKLPATEDPDYASLDHLMRHILRAGRGYMTWCCEVLSLPDPQLDPPPEVAEIAARGADYLEYLLEKWRAPLAGVEEPQLEVVAKSRWGVEHSIEAMLEHAVVHPLRHSFQLKELMNA